MGQQWPATWAGALGAADLSITEALLEEVTINLIVEPPELTGLGKQTLGGHKQNFVHTRTQEKGAVTAQETEPDLPMECLESLAVAWVSGGLLQGQGALS